MPIIIDTNCFANVFSKSSTNHEDFKPVLDWIIKGKGMIVFGGTKYKQELAAASKFLTIFRLLKDVGKVHEGNKENIDSLQKSIELKITDPDFDDPHLPAIVLDTKCRLICSVDKRSIKFVTNGILYPSGFQKPVYYTQHSNKDLLCDNYIDDKMKPLCKITKSQISGLEKILQ